MSDQFKPGQVVTHPERGAGLVAYSWPGCLWVRYVASDGGHLSTRDLTGWQPVETCTDAERRILDHFQDVRKGRAAFRMVGNTIICDASNSDNEVVKPGHVQVRVDDLDLSGWDHEEECGRSDEERLAIRVTKAAQPASHTGAAIAESVADFDASNYFPGQHFRDRTGDEWVYNADDTMSYVSADGAVYHARPSASSVSRVWGPLVPITPKFARDTSDDSDGQAATSQGQPTVTLPCPDCGEDITNTVVVRFDPDALSGGYYLGFDGEYPVMNHRCKPKEPKGLGAVVTVVAGGIAQPYTRFASATSYASWISPSGARMTWRQIIRGTSEVRVLSEGVTVLTDEDA